jgi:hypothetical protein
MLSDILKSRPGPLIKMKERVVEGWMKMKNKGAGRDTFM